MAMQEGSPAPGPTAQVVGNAFVQQYYHILHQSPELVHRFYQDSSFLSRPNVNGDMSTVTTMQAINEKILSLNYDDYTVEIETADAQESYEKGVIVVVTGCLTRKDNVRKKFTQTFFLAPQDKGYFVFNDIFRYIGENDLHINSLPANGITENTSASASASASVSASASAPEPEPIRDHQAVEPEAYPEGEDLDNGAEVCDPSDKEEGSVIEEETDEPQNNARMNESLIGADSAPVAQQDTPKKSYAAILKVMRSSIVSTPVLAPTNNVRVAPPDQQSFAPVKPAAAPEASVPSSENAPDGGNVNNEAEGHSIYVRNLPFNATPAQLEEAFIKFGPIKRNGIQVRSNKQGFTFGFVEFEMSSSVHGALEDSPITIGDRQAVVEEKRTNTRVGTSGGGSGRGGRYSSGKGGFRSDSFRGRSGNYGGGRGYGRNNEFRNQGEFSGRPKGGRNTGNYQRANQDESGRSGGRQGGAKV